MRDRISRKHQTSLLILLTALLLIAVCSAGCSPSPVEEAPDPGPADQNSAAEEEAEERTGSVQDARVDDETIDLGQPPEIWPSGPDLTAWVGEDPQALEWRPPLYQSPLALRPEDHFYFTRPIPSGEVNWSHPYYRYGNTYFGESSIHTGVDMGAELGTPVLAAGSGEVIWVGYGLYRGAYDPEDPYGLAVAIRHDCGHLSQILFTIYGHLLTADVWPGQRVDLGEVIGSVGNSGHSTGPHLHFEVRLGENRYFGTRNPELWMVPPQGWGVLAGRVLDTPGRTLKEYLVQIESLETGDTWKVWTYAEGTVFSDELYGENFAISDLPAGPYEIHIDYLGVRHTIQMYIFPGMTNYFVFNGRNGFTIEPDLDNRSFTPFDTQ